jgi:hypothetical protein
MAKSIYATLTEMKTETSVPVTGKMIEHTLPASLLPTPEEFENEEMLLAWAEDKGITHACLQKGVQKFIIDLRAIFKAVKKDETWSLEKGQKAVNEAKWSTIDRPKVNSELAIKNKAVYEANISIARAMLATKGITEKMVISTLTASCGADLAKVILEALENENDLDDTSETETEE